MWGKTTDRESTLDTPRAASSQLAERTSGFEPPKTATSVGKTMRLQGEMYSDEEMYVDGELEGTLEVTHRLTIGPNGKVKANVKAKELVVKGWIQGNVEAADRIIIMNGASIIGDVKTSGIVIEDGAYFKGGIDILNPDVKKPEAFSSPLAAAVGARSDNKST